MLMKVQPNRVVTLHYRLFLEDTGELVEDTEAKGAPFQFIYGINQILPALEAALLDMEAGEEKEIVLTPEEAYGPVDPDAVDVLDRAAFGDLADDLVPGMMFYATTQGGQQIPFYVKEIQEDKVVIDFNHPLAGETLRFQLKVEDVREATPEELAHGHVHTDLEPHPEDETEEA